MAKQLTSFPGVIQEIAEIAGNDAAWAIARAKGGREVYIPAQAAADHWLTELVGLEAAQKICAFYRADNSGTHLLIPMGSRVRIRAELARAIERGGSNGDIAGEFGKHERTVRRHRARIRDARQGKLF